MEAILASEESRRRSIVKKRCLAADPMGVAEAVEYRFEEVEAAVEMELRDAEDAEEWACRF